MSPQYEKKPYSNLSSPLKSEEIFNLRGHTGLIAGGAGNLSLEYSKVLIANGAEICLADKNSEKLTEQLNTIYELTGVKPLGITCDFSDPKEIEKLFETFKAKFKKLDFLVYNVMAKPTEYYAPFDQYTYETWKAIIDGNLTGAFFCSQQASRLMEHGGSIVLTGSIYGLVGPRQDIYENCTPKENAYKSAYPLNTPAAYSASKGALLAMSRHLATTLAPKGIRVNSLIPGGIYDNQEESFHTAYLRHTPLNRMAVWSDFSGPMLFLTSSASRYMTGTQLVIDGGWTAW